MLIVNVVKHQLDIFYFFRKILLYFSENFLYLLGFQLKLNSMYFAIKQDVNDTETYQYFLYEILSNNNSNYISIFRDVILQSKRLIETKDFYSISSERFGIISFFAQFGDVIMGMNPDDLKKEDFEKLNDCFELECLS